MTSSAFIENKIIVIPAVEDQSGGLLDPGDTRDDLIDCSLDCLIIVQAQILDGFLK
jgi:hypothetical protein